MGGTTDTATTATTTRVLLADLVIGESPRWHDGTRSTVAKSIRMTFRMTATATPLSVSAPARLPPGAGHPEHSSRARTATFAPAGMPAASTRGSLPSARSGTPPGAGGGPALSGLGDPQREHDHVVGRVGREPLHHDVDEPLAGHVAVAV